MSQGFLSDAWKHVRTKYDAADAWFQTVPPFTRFAILFTLSATGATLGFNYADTGVKSQTPPAAVSPTPVASQTMPAPK